ncbi:glycosyltransferase [Deinococcus sp. SDU3-2]|uniref:Glycosyltransferase n=1 Tax=Deinococcus terrestris TaxID=2651870 RepID=A0A7X1NWZ0_9DEIO|nr:glycosyltransferase [Deinococcus terrestris]MPY67343.1 glycosyltransferase [Deinococcus terrestris]
MPVSPPRTVVAVPARNEAGRIGRAVRALAAQVGAGGRPLTGYEVWILVNNSADDTAGRAMQASPVGGPVRVLSCTLPPGQANVVGARRAALELAAARLGEDPDGLIVTTDADSVPAPDWLWQLQRAVCSGADAACGRILLRPEERARLPGLVRRVYLQDAAYRLAAERLTARLNPDPFDPWPRHHQHFGANLALTLRAYREVGGVPDVPHLEDVALVQSLRRHDLRVRRTPHARVHTSARLSGRVSLGLSTQLAEWHADPAAWRVPGAAEVAALARAEAALKEARKQGWHPGLPGRWLAPAAVLRRALRAPTLGLGLELAHAARLGAGLWAGHYAPVPVARALAEVRGQLQGAAPEGEAAQDSGLPSTSSR